MLVHASRWHFVVQLHVRRDERIERRIEVLDYLKLPEHGISSFAAPVIVVRISEGFGSFMFLIATCWARGVTSAMASEVGSSGTTGSLFYASLPPLETSV